MPSSWKVLPADDQALYESVAASFDRANFMQSWEWGQLKATTGWRPVRLLLFEDDTPRGAATLLVRRLTRFGHRLAYCPGGPCLDYADSPAVEQMLLALKTTAAREKAFLCKLDPRLENDHPAAATVREALKKTGFLDVSRPTGFGGLQPRCVMVLELAPSLEELLAACKPKWRYNIRLAERKGVQVRTSLEPGDMRRFYDLLQVTAERDGFTVRAFSYFQAFFDLLVRPGRAFLYLAEHEGELLAAALAVRFAAQTWYLYGASSNSKRNLMPNHLLQWRMLADAKAAGSKLYNFRGVSQHAEPSPDDPLSGLNRFKAGFGARFVQYLGEFDLPLRPFSYWLYRKVRG